MQEKGGPNLCWQAKLEERGNIRNLNMKVSILINNYNYGRFLRQCIQSASAQDYRDIEIVVVDDGSTDNSAEILAEFDSRVHVVRQANAGQFLALAKGLSHCSGEYVFLLDSDDYWPTNYIAAAVEGIERNRKPDLVFCGVTAVNEKGEPTGFRATVDRDIDHGYNYVISQYAPALFLGNTTSAIAIKRAVLSAILGEARSLGTRFVVNADDVIVVGADLLGYRKVFLAGASMFYRVHGGSVNARMKRTTELEYRYFMLKCMLFPLLRPSAGVNPYLRRKMSFAWEFETKANIPFAEAIRYAKSAVLHGRPHRLRQAWRIFAHWRSVGTSRNRMVHWLLKPENNRDCP
jgi:glycosyltransferase involved in cell wall biosynthesis